MYLRAIAGALVGGRPGDLDGGAGERGGHHTAAAAISAIKEEWRHVGHRRARSQAGVEPVLCASDVRAEQSARRERENASGRAGEVHEHGRARRGRAPPSRVRSEDYIRNLLK